MIQYGAGKNNKIWVGYRIAFTFVQIKKICLFSFTISLFFYTEQALVLLHCGI